MMTPTSPDWQKVREDFPALDPGRHPRPLVYLDSGASAQKPRAVIERMVECLEAGYANVHRGVHYLSEKATTDYEQARHKVQGLLGAGSPDEIVFGMNATSLINLVAHCYAGRHFGAGDEVLITAMEHHANIVPWQMAAERAGFVVRVVPLLSDGSLDLEALGQMLGEGRVRLVAVTHISNVLGTVNPVEEIIRQAHAAEAVVLVDGCQGVVHARVTVAAWDADFYCGSGHKLYGPSGIGFLYGKGSLLETMPPLLGGGDMIERVTFEGSSWAMPPARFEPGTPPIVEGIGLTAAIDYLEGIGVDQIRAREAELTAYLLESLRSIEGLTVYGDAAHRAGVASFSLAGAHPHDLAQLIDQFGGVAVRSGHHCAMPLHDLLNVPYGATVRASLGLYNNQADIDALVAALHKARKILNVQGEV